MQRRKAFEKQCWDAMSRNLREFISMVLRVQMTSGLTYSNFLINRCEELCAQHFREKLPDHFGNGTIRKMMQEIFEKDDILNDWHKEGVRKMDSP